MSLQQGPGVKYTHIADMWSCGVILFVLLGGYPPFYDEHEPTLFNLIRKGQLKFDDPVWGAISDRCVPQQLLGAAVLKPHARPCMG